MNDPTLKPCPFCGKDPEHQTLEPHSHALTFGGFKMPDYPGGATVECTCGAGLIDDSLEAVVARWNTRTPPTEGADT